MPYPLEDDWALYITRCMMLGCVFRYDNFGHPERDNSRKYHTCDYTDVAGGVGIRRTGYGHSQAEAAYDYLRRYHQELL